MFLATKSEKDGRNCRLPLMLFCFVCLRVCFLVTERAAGNLLEGGEHQEGNTRVRRGWSATNSSLR